MKVLRGIAIFFMFVGFFVVAGILGGITEFNKPLSNALWIVPVGIVSIICAIIGGLIQGEVEEIKEDE